MNHPLVSVVLATCDRPDFLPVALACWRQQIYAPLELLVIDDGRAFPADAETVAASGGRLLRVDEGMPLGTKLNCGLVHARGELCLKADDDDWYGPTFLEAMVARFLEKQTRVCRPTIAGLSPFLVFDVGRWRLSEYRGSMSGATILFQWDNWNECRFREISLQEDSWFVRDQVEAGASFVPVPALDTYLAVRHGGDQCNRGHGWTHEWTGPGLGEHPRQHPSALVPERLLPDWALEVYRKWHDGLAVPRAGEGEAVA